ncbi:hypothetical protein ICR45_003438 [Vibrio cholerae]|uniref:restriction endonuclease PLD domain-containing protein n=1 Tax=Vibrio cholerae TaxID=666 RepID=UPI000F0BB951|nr:restriction endonuclease PLD domain-containing protein [Vibrio cholerae]EGQ7791303.1 hypothetical protein [Vibrio cholerae]EHS1094477.1 hypothetical protein [Vibrio cholerae]EJH6267092.1 hypothetical protein [Vibrio cholerae]EJL6307622.1 hypothetical protein [Vibrio cholerae]EJL7181047.1 hypothetical protein [Vibrio cholerae]
MLLSNINNSQIENLKLIIKENNNKLVIVSPYLADDMKLFLDNFDFSLVKTIELITTFKPRDIEQISKPYQLKDFFEYFNDKYPNVTSKIHVCNSLHGKLYFSISKRKELIITSSNFTVNGMFNNEEWGVRINDDSIVEQALDEVYGVIEYPDVTYFQVKRACQFAEVYSKKNPQWDNKPEVMYDILDSVYSDTDKDNKNPKYFLKPIGYKEDPVTLDEKRDFSKLHQNLHFSKKMPKSVKKGDVIITTAVGAGSLLSYFKVTSSIQMVTQEQIKNEPWAARWPWFLEGKNNSTEFGSKWWLYNLRRQDLLAEFREKYPSEPVTYAGGFTLGTINMGNDKVRLSEKFAKFLISKIEECSVPVA